MPADRNRVRRPGLRNDARHRAVLMVRDPDGVRRHDERTRLAPDRVRLGHATRFGIDEADGVRRQLNGSRLASTEHEGDAERDPEQEQWDDDQRRSSMPQVGTRADGRVFGDGRPGVTGRRFERRVVREDRSFQILELPAGFEAQLFREHSPRVLVGGERVGLAPRAVEGQHQLRAEALAQRVLTGERLELDDELFVSTERELAVDPSSERVETLFSETFNLVARERFERYVRKRGAAPERKRLAVEGRGMLRLAVHGKRTRLDYAAPEAGDVERVRLNTEHVAGRSRRDQGGSE